MGVLYSQPSHAFIFIRGGSYANQGERPVSRALTWTGRTVQFHINTDTTTYGGSITAELSAAEFLSAVNQAIAAWNSVCGSDIMISLAGTTTNQKAAGDSVNAIVWDNRTTAEGNQFTSTSTLAFAASATIAATDLYVDCDIVVNGEGTGTLGINGEASKIDLVGILAHEMGHCLGLDHSVQAPTWTSTNNILNTATMAATISVGDLEARTISQDEVDGMECVNPTGKSSRSGTRCGSYHGTNGNGALTGVVSGGPTETLGCPYGTGTSTSVATSSEDGGGCITKALAAEDRHSARAVLGSWFVDVLGLCALYFVVASLRRWRRGRATLAIFLAATGAALLSAPAAHAFSFAAGLEQRWTKPTLLNNAASLGSNDGTFSRIDPAETFARMTDARADLLFGSALRVHYGVFGRYLLPTQVEQKGLDGANTVLLTKTTKLTGFSGGPIIQLYLTDPKENVSVFVEGLAGLGKLTLDQSIVGSAGDTHTLKAGAWSVETAASAGLAYRFAPAFCIAVKGGYSRYKSNGVTADEVSGSRYSGVTAGKRMTVNDGGTTKDLVIDRSGFTASIVLSLGF